jgi:hypothetical protein
MFYNYAQFKKATKTLHEEMRSKEFKLSEVRLRLVQTMGFNSVQAYEASFDREVSKTITVVSMEPQQNISKKDFVDNDEGHKQAIAYFTELMLSIEPDMDESEIECYIDDGYYHNGRSEYSFYIVHTKD